LTIYEVVKDLQVLAVQKKKAQYFKLTEQLKKLEGKLLEGSVLGCERSPYCTVTRCLKLVFKLLIAFVIPKRF